MGTVLVPVAGTVGPVVASMAVVVVSPTGNVVIGPAGNVVGLGGNVKSRCAAGAPAPSKILGACLVSWPALIQISGWLRLAWGGPGYRYGSVMVRKHLWVKGRVQGVWYRGSCAEQARALGVSGWARNLPDGRVEVVAEGDDDAVGRLVSWCHEGPPSALVTAVEQQVEAPEGLRGFLVR